MLIVCPNCSTSYQVGAASLGAGGRSVRCARCRTVWFATPVAEVAAAAAETTAATDFDAAPASAPAAAPGSARKQDDWGSYTPWDEAQAGDGAAAPAEDAGAGADAFGDAAGFGMDEAAATIDSPSLAPETPGPEPAAGQDREAEGGDIESFAARRERQHHQRRLRLRSHGLLAAIALLLMIEAALIGWRAHVVALLPQTASFFSAIGLPVNVRGLVFAGVTSTTDVQDGATILSVEGTIANKMRKPLEVPRLRFAIRDQGGHEIYAWTALPTRAALDPGETLPFHAQLASPPAEARDVVVRFFTRRDAPVTAR